MCVQHTECVLFAFTLQNVLITLMTLLSAAQLNYSGLHKATHAVYQSSVPLRGLLKGASST